MSVHVNEDMQLLCSLDPNRVLPLRWLEEERKVLREIFADLGFTLDISAIEEHSLSELQFRSKDQGRGPGMKAVLGEDRLNSLLELCADVAQDEHSRIKSGKTSEPIEGTEGRGLQQAAADIVSFAVLGWPLSENALIRLHKRVLRWWVKEMNASRISEVTLLGILTTFKNAGLDEYPSAKTASANPDHLWYVWLFLTGNEIS